MRSKPGSADAQRSLPSRSGAHRTRSLPLRRGSCRRPGVFVGHRSENPYLTACAFARSLGRSSPMRVPAWSVRDEHPDSCAADAAAKSRDAAAAVDHRHALPAADGRAPACRLRAAHHRLRNSLMARRHSIEFHAHGKSRFARQPDVEVEVTLAGGATGRRRSVGRIPRRA